MFTALNLIAIVLTITHKFALYPSSLLNFYFILIPNSGYNFIFVSKMKNEVWFQRTWCTVHIVLGILFSVIFVLGALSLNEYSYFFYLILSGGLIYFGWNRLRKPYVTYTENSILVHGFLGDIIYRYQFENRSEITVKEKKLYLKDTKLKMNAWFVNKTQWENMLRFFSNKISKAEELQD